MRAALLVVAVSLAGCSASEALPPGGGDGGGGCAQPPCCRKSGDCASGTSCYPPGMIGCGVCLMGACSNDSGCPDQVCERGPCVCSPTGMACFPRCTASSCAAGQVCNTAGHCRPQSCGTCPPDFSCIGSICVRTSCVTDGDCAPAGFCVGGSCYPTLGQCIAPVP
jgi:hypothetical protein